MSTTRSSLGVGVVMGLLIGAGGVYGLQVLMAPPPEVPVLPVTPPPKIVKVFDEQALYEARREIDELKSRLAKQASEPAKPEVVKTESAEKKDPIAQIASMISKEITPEQKAEWEKRRTEFMQQMQKRATERTDFLSSLDTANMNEKQRGNHEKLLACVSRMNELRNAMSDGKTEVTDQMRTEMHDLGHSMDDLYKEERSTLLEITGRNMGYNDKQSREFAEQIQTIYDNTSVHRSSWGHGRRSTQ
jgi:hypothetical protein